MARATSTPRRKTHRTASAAEANVVSATSNRWITAGVLALYLAGSVVSFFGLYGIAPWLKVPEQAWVFVVIFIDLGIIVYKFAEIRLRLDPRKQHLAYKAKAGVLISTIVSSGANTFHVIQAADPDPIKFYAGAAVAGLSPWFIYLAGLVLTDVVVKPKPRRRDVSRETLPVVPQPQRPAQRTRRPRSTARENLAKTLTTPPGEPVKVELAGSSPQVEKPVESEEWDYEKGERPTFEARREIETRPVEEAGAPRGW